MPGLLRGMARTAVITEAEFQAQKSRILGT
jgi:hypothetical protein